MYFVVTIEESKELTKQTSKQLISCLGASEERISRFANQSLEHCILVQDHSKCKEGTWKVTKWTKASAIWKGRGGWKSWQVEDNESKNCKADPYCIICGKITN